MQTARRLPGRPPLPRPALSPEAEATTFAQVSGRLVGVEGSDILEILHVELGDPGQRPEQLALTRLVNRPVVISVALVEAGDGPVE